MKVLMVTPELAPIVSVGGVAEYCLGLARALLARGHEVRVAVPLYSFLRNGHGFNNVVQRLPVRLGVGASDVTSVLEAPFEEGGAGTVMALGSHRHFDSASEVGHVYAWPEHSPEPWIAFSRAIVDWLGSTPWRPDIVHCQDAHTALVPVYLSVLESINGSPPPPTLLTVHNLLNQGRGSRDVVAYAGLAPEVFDRLFEFWGQASCFKAGLLSARRVNTVSPTYAEEICASDDYGFGLSGVLSSLRDRARLSGVLNGIDNSRWALDGVRYDGAPTNIDRVFETRRSARHENVRQWRWSDDDRPVLAFRSRWDAQKGVGVLSAAMEALLATGVRVIIVTWGVPGVGPLHEAWARLEELASLHPDGLLLNPPGLSEQPETALHYKVSDLLLMPSRYEPCGLAQMEAGRFGTPSIVRRTGGLADTISECPTDCAPHPNGFVFERLTPEDLLAAVGRARAAHQNEERWRQLVAGSLRRCNDWSERVAAYEELYSVPPRAEC